MVAARASSVSSWSEGVHDSGVATASERRCCEVELSSSNVVGRAVVDVIAGNGEAVESVTELKRRILLDFDLRRNQTGIPRLSACEGVDLLRLRLMQA